MPHPILDELSIFGDENDDDDENKYHPCPKNINEMVSYRPMITITPYIHSGDFYLDRKTFLRLSERRKKFELGY